MRKFKLKEKLMNVKTEVKRICNNCGLEYDDEKSEFGYETWQWDTIHHFIIHFGYGSLHDMEHWHFDLCEKCIDEITSKFKVPVQIAGEDSLGELPLGK